MLTTDGSNFAARSAKLSGAGRDARVAGATTRKAATTLATAREVSFEERDDTRVNSTSTKRMIIFYRSFGASLLTGSQDYERSPRQASCFVGAGGGIIGG